MKKVSLKINEDNQNYNEIYQQLNVRFSFLKRVEGEENSFRELFPKVLCRDYLSDCVSAAILNESEISGIYGFILSEMIETSELLMSVSVTSEYHFKKGLRIIRNIEKEFKDLKTPVTFYKTKTNNNYVIVADKAWLKNSLTISLFSLLIRCINYNTPEYRKFENLFIYIKNNQNGNDADYIKSLKSLDIRFVLSNIDDILGSDPAVGFTMGMLNNTEFFSVEDAGVPLSEYFHNNSGIISFAKNIKNIKKHNVFISFIGSKWVNNYHKLLNITTLEPSNCNGIIAGQLLTVINPWLSIANKQAIILQITGNIIYYAVDNEALKCTSSYNYDVDTNVLKLL